MKTDQLLEDYFAVLMPNTAAFLLVALGRFVLLSSYALYQEEEGRSPLAIAHLLLETPPFMAFVLYTLHQALLFLRVLLLVVGVFSLHARELEGAAVAQMAAATVVQFLPHFRRRTSAHEKGCSKEQPQQSSTASELAVSGLLTSRRFSSALGTIWASTFMRKHCRLLVDLVLFNRHFASLLIFWFFLPVIVLSVYILCVLYFLSVPLLLKAYLSGIYLLMLLLISILALLPMVT